jgi:hypothetical protein
MLHQNLKHVETSGKSSALKQLNRLDSSATAADQDKTDPRLTPQHSSYATNFDHHCDFTIK